MRTSLVRVLLRDKSREDRVVRFRGISSRQVHGGIRANFWPPFRALVIARVDQEYRNPRAELDPDTGAVVGDSRINAHSTGVHVRELDTLRGESGPTRPVHFKLAELMQSVSIAAARHSRFWRGN